MMIYFREVHSFVCHNHRSRCNFERADYCVHLAFGKRKKSTSRTDKDRVKTENRKTEKPKKENKNKEKKL